MREDVEFHPQAELEVDESASFFELRVDLLGDEFLSELETGLDYILNFPPGSKFLKTHGVFII